MKFHPLIVSALLLSPFTVGHVAAADAVVLDEAGVRNLGIETEVVAPADFEITAFALGTTEAIPENRSVLSSRIPGRVIENRIELGEFVEKGDKLLLIESLQPGDPPPSVWLTAPSDGNILSMSALLGSPVGPADRLAEIADLRRLYLVVMLPQTTAGKIVQGAKARIRFPLRPEIEYTAVLRQHAVCACPNPACALGLDMSTRKEGGNQDFNTAGVVFTIENPHSELRPQMNAECSIILESRSGVLSVPREAVHGSPDERHVFIKHPSIPYAFERVMVQTGASGNARIEIVEGLSEGDEVVSRGSYSLGFVGGSGGGSLKEALDIAHGHEHNEDGTKKESGADAGADDHEGHDHADEDIHADEHADEHEGEHDHADEHDHEGENDHTDEHGHIELRELAFIISTGILSVLLAVVLLRRRGSNISTNELS